MAVHAAYDLMWLSGVALAAEQLKFQAGAPDWINRNGMQFHAIVEPRSRIELVAAR